MALKKNGQGVLCDSCSTESHSAKPGGWLELKTEDGTDHLCGSCAMDEELVSSWIPFAEEVTHYPKKNR